MLVRALVAVAFCVTPVAAAPASRPATQPVPQLQILPQPYDQASFTSDGQPLVKVR